MKTVCDINQCVGCRLCEEICPVGAIRADDGINAYNAIIDEEKCLECNLCHKNCPRNTIPSRNMPSSWYQGWSSNQQIRENSASGGVATAVAKAFIMAGGEVCTCRFEQGSFRFFFFSRQEEMDSAVGSKYVKSDPRGIYKPLKEKLHQKKKVLIIGLPCQIAAAKNSIRDEDSNFLYTVDLVCHGTPSPEVLGRYLMGKGYDIDKAQGILFRAKISQRESAEYSAVSKGDTDTYTYAFLNGYTYTECCYSCPYACLERTGDLTLGDSWGTELSREEKDKGISLILCQTEKGRELMNRASLVLHDVDLEKAVAANSQLREPSPKPKKRDMFLLGIQKGKRFDKLLWKVEPKRAAKNVIKKQIKRILRRKDDGHNQISFAIRLKGGHREG